MDLPECSRQMHRLSFGESERCKYGRQVVWGSIADGIPASKAFNHGLEDPFRDRGLCPRAQEGQNQLA